MLRQDFVRRLRKARTATFKVHLECFNVKDASICFAHNHGTSESKTNHCAQTNVNHCRPSTGSTAHTHTHTAEKLWRKREENYSIHFNYRDWISDLDACRSEPADGAAANREPNAKWHKQANDLSGNTESCPKHWPPSLLGGDSIFNVIQP